MGLDQFKNFATATLAATLPDASTTTFTVASGHGLLLPAVPFNAVAWNSTDFASPDLDPSVEIVRVTAKATDTLTVVRAQEGTTGATHNTGGKTYKLLATVTAKTLTSDVTRVLYAGVGLLAQNNLSVASFLPGATALSIPIGYLAAGDSLVVEAKWSKSGGTTNVFGAETVIGGVTSGMRFDVAAGTGQYFRTVVAIVSSTVQRFHTHGSRDDFNFFSSLQVVAVNLATTALTIDLRGSITGGPGGEIINLDNYCVTLRRAT